MSNKHFDNPPKQVPISNINEGLLCLINALNCSNTSGR